MTMYDVLLTPWLGMPLWVWFSFVAVVIALLVFDLGVLHREAHEVGVTESLWMSAFYIGLGLAWALAVWWIYATYGSADSVDARVAAAATPEERGWTAVKLYITGFLVEKTLALDNVFVISMIFTYFAVPRIYQHRVLLWGILGVIVLRALMIGLGAALVQEFDWVMVIFALVLVGTGIKMLLVMDQKPDIASNPLLKFLKKRLRVTPELHGQRFFVRLPDAASGRPVLWATPLFLCIVLVEFADLIFAIDSVPAIFAITPDAFIVYTSNIFAILGLRALYFALAAMVHRFHYLKYSLALVLIFIGAKIVLGDFVWQGKVPAELSLGVTALLIAGGVAYSLWKTRGGPVPGPAVAEPSRGRSEMSVTDVMTRTVATISPEASVGAASEQMAKQGSTCLVVVEASGRPIGIITEGDLIRREVLGRGPSTSLWRSMFTDDRTLARAFAKAHGRKVGEVMSRDLAQVSPDASVRHAAELLYTLGVRALPVVESGRVVGLLSRSEIVRTLGALGAQLASESATDSAIHEELGARISRAGWVSPQQVSYAVRDGRVEYSGTVTSEDQRLALHALAEGIAGVKEVVDRLTLTSRFAVRPA